MIDKRPGDYLWFDWSGDGYEPSRLAPILFYTEDHVDTEHEVVKRALASALQRDGSVNSLGEAYHAVERAKTSLLYAGSVGGEVYLTICNEHGETHYGDQVDEVIPITLVEI